MPGFELARRCAEAYEAAVRKLEAPTVMVLERHGIFTWGETAKESYERDGVVAERRARPESGLHLFRDAIELNANLQERQTRVVHEPRLWKW